MPTTNLSLGCRPCGEFHAGRAVLLVLAQLSFLPFARHDRNFRKSGTGQTPASRSRSRRVGSGKSRRRILKREVTNGYLRGVGRHPRLAGSLLHTEEVEERRVSPEVSATRTRYHHSIRARSRVRYHYSRQKVAGIASLSALSLYSRSATRTRSPPSLINPSTDARDFCFFLRASPVPSEERKNISQGRDGRTARRHRAQ